MKNAPKSHGYGSIVDLCLTRPAIARKKQETAGGFSAHPCYNKDIHTQEEGRTVSKTTLFDSRIKKYAYREVTQLYGELGSSPAGLSSHGILASAGPMIFAMSDLLRECDRLEV